MADTTHRTPSETPTATPAVTVVEDALFTLPAPQTATQVPPKPRPIDADVIAILDELKANPDLAEDRRKVVTAIVAEARSRAGKVDPNRVRARIADPDSGKPALIRPQVVGAVYGALRAAGVLTFDGYVTSTDKAGRNAGRPARAYRLARIPTGEGRAA